MNMKVAIHDYVTLLVLYMVILIFLEGMNKCKEST